LSPGTGGKGNRESGKGIDGKNDKRTFLREGGRGQRIPVMSVAERTSANQGGSDEDVGKNGEVRKRNIANKDKGGGDPESSEGPLCSKGGGFK